MSFLYKIVFLNKRQPGTNSQGMGGALCLEVSVQITIVY